MSDDGSKKVRLIVPAAGHPLVGMAPLVDIVLLLISFYLIVAKSMADLDDAAVTPPVVRAEQLAPAGPADLVLNLRSDGSVTVSGQLVTQPQLAQMIRTSADANASGRVVVRADRAQPFAQLHELLNLIRDQGSREVALRTLEHE